MKRLMHTILFGAMILPQLRLPPSLRNATVELHVADAADENVRATMPTEHLGQYDVALVEHETSDGLLPRREFRFLFLHDAESYVLRCVSPPERHVEVLMACRDLMTHLELPAQSDAGFILQGLDALYSGTEVCTGHIRDHLRETPLGEGLVFLLQGRRDKAQQELHRLLKEEEKPLVLLLSALSLPPMSAEALALLKRAAAMDGGEFVNAWIGWRFEQEGRYDLAAAWYEAAYRIDRDPLAAARRSLLALRDGNLRLASHWLTKTDPRTALGKLAQLTFQVARGDMLAALETYRSSEESLCGTLKAQAAHAAAQASLALGDRSGAEHFLQQSLESDPGYLPTYREWLRLVKGDHTELLAVVPNLMVSLEKVSPSPPVTDLKTVLAAVLQDNQ